MATHPTLRAQTSPHRAARAGGVVGIALAFVLQACDSRATGAAGDDPAVQARVQELVQRSRQRLSYVPAGGFWLGDPGPLMTDKLKETGAVLGPEAQPTGNLPYTITPDNKPPRWVTLDAFSIQQLKVTYGDFDVYVAAHDLPAHPPMGDDKSFGRIWVRSRTANDVPAGVTWKQARDYCLWLGKVSGLPFDLPTEAQWEFAASNGRKTHWEPAATDNGMMQRGTNHPTRSQLDELRKYSDFLYPVGRYPPSKLKLHDLVGNGFEWTLDWYAPDAYQAMTNTHNPAGPASGTEKVKRGFPVNEDIAFSGFQHTKRYHALPDGQTYEGRLWHYARDGLRCVVNSKEPIPGSYTDGPPPVSNPLAGSKS